jgi:hypothetical protein
MKKYAMLFGVAFALNLLWENLHAQLYLNYQGGRITEWILLRATFWDALIITAVFLATRYLRFNKIIFPLILFFVAVIMEMWALRTGRWAYAAAMPLLPFLHVGLSPAVQLALTGFLAARFARG